MRSKIQGTSTVPKGLQKAITAFLTEPSAKVHQVLHSKLRQRMARWDFGDVPIGHAVFRAELRLRYLNRKVRPAVHAVYIKTLLNGWTTARRMRTLNLNGSNGVARARRKCVFCVRGDDSLEHMPRCIIVKNLFLKHCCSCNSLLHFFALDQNSFPLLFVTKVKLLSVLFTVYNALTHSDVTLNVHTLIHAAEVSIL